MKKILDIVAFTLALNFLAVVGGLGYLYRTGHLDKERAVAVKDIVFPKPATQPATKPVEADATTQPSFGLDELLAKAAGRPAGEQVEFLQRAFDSRAADVERRLRELADKQTTIDAATAKLAEAREALAKAQADLDARERESTRLASDKGFQDSLTLYSGMPARQVKAIFMSMSDEVVVRYFQAMSPRTATKVMKEFKSAEETDRLQKLMERMRLSTAAANPTTAPAASVTP